MSSDRRRDEQRQRVGRVHGKFEHNIVDPDLAAGHVVIAISAPANDITNWFSAHPIPYWRAQVAAKQSGSSAAVSWRSDPSIPNATRRRPQADMARNPSGCGAKRMQMWRRRKQMWRRSGAKQIATHCRFEPFQGLSRRRKRQPALALLPPPISRINTYD
jgi:hypothetical protein